MGCRLEITMKKILGVYSAPRSHWVGDGFPVRSIFSYYSHGEYLNPFLLLDHAGPHTFQPTEDPRGVGQHPHRGFETVTIVYEGEVAHHDSTGAGGTIGPGDVQWMTAASGILHQEYHSPAFSQRGGTLDMVQLWVNLPAKDKKGPAGYQTLVESDIPSVALPNGGGRVRVIAGEYGAHKGPARTHTAMHVWDVRLDAGHQTTFEVVDGWPLALVVLKGAVRVSGGDQIREDHVAVMSREGQSVLVEATGDTSMLLLTGAPIDEPVVGQGPFVMNSQIEIAQAFDDFNSGRFGQLRQQEVTRPPTG